jgi:hypothetical protein
MSGVDTAHAASFVDSEMARVNSPPFIDGAAAASEAFDRLLAEVRACTLCAPHLTHGPRPVLRGRPSARLLIISQAPGVRVHETGISFNDRSGDRLREWLALATLKEYLEHERTPTGWWHNFPKYAVSLLKAYYGDAARPDNDFGFGWVPRIVGDHSQLPMTLAMRDGVIRGMFMLGQNPAVGGHNAALVHRGLAELDWLVVRDMTETETASFWYAGRPVRDGELHPRDIRTEVFLTPASLSAEKAGSVTNTHRLLQWHDKVVSGPGDSRSDLWFTFHRGRRLTQLYAGSTDPKDAGLSALT